MNKENIRKIILDIKKENINLNAKSPCSLACNKVIFKKYQSLYPSLFRNSEIIHIFKFNNIEELLNDMFCYCGRKKIYTSSFKMPYSKYCSPECCKKSKEYQSNRYKSWIKTWNSHTKEQKDMIHKKQQENRRMSEESIKQMVENRKKTVSKWTEEFKNKYSKKLSEGHKIAWKRKTQDEKKEIGNKISKALNTICNNGLTVSQNAIIKGSKTYQQKTGYTNASFNPEIKNKISKANKENFKERFELAKNTMNERYGGWYTSSEKHKELWKNKDFKDKFLEKQYIAKKNNNSFNSSNPEDESFLKLKQKFPDIVHHYKDERYPFNCDFYIPSKDLFIELNFHWTHGKVIFNKDNPEHIKRLEEWKIKGSKYFLNAIETWTKRDPLKLETFKKNKLNYKIFYEENQFNDWLNNL